MRAARTAPVEETPVATVDATTLQAFLRWTATGMQDTRMGSDILVMRAAVLT